MMRLNNAVLWISIMVIGACASAPKQADTVLFADPGAPLPEANEGEATAELRRAIVLIQNEKFAEAKSHLDRANEIRHENAEQSYYLGVVLEKTGDRTGAENAYKKAISLNASLSEAALNLGAMFLDEPARPDDAIVVLKPALERNPNDPLLQQNLALAYALKKDADNAGKLYEALLAKQENKDIRLAYGQVLVDVGRFDAAADQYRKVLEGAGTDVGLISQVGNLLGEAKDYASCVKAFDRAIKVNAKEAKYYLHRGICRHELKQEASARADYDQALKVDPKFAPAHYYMALSWITERKRQVAAAELRKCIKLAGDAPIGKMAQQKLDELFKK